MTWQMCPNEECPEFRVPTKFKGGCECGDALVSYLPKTEPTTRQLAQMVSAASLARDDVANLSVEEVEAALEERPGHKKHLLQTVGQLEAAIRTGTVPSGMRPVEVPSAD